MLRCKSHVIHIEVTHDVIIFIILSVISVLRHDLWTLSLYLIIFGISLTSWSQDSWVLDPSVHVIWLSSCDSFLPILRFRSYTSKLILNYLFFLYYLLVRVLSSHHQQSNHFSSKRMLKENLGFSHFKDSRSAFK